MIYNILLDSQLDMLDMLDKLLSFNPMTRMLTEQALARPYIGEYYTLMMNQWQKNPSVMS